MCSLGLLSEDSQNCSTFSEVKSTKMSFGNPEEVEPCPPLFPLSLSYPLPNPNPNLVDEGSTTKTTIKLCDFSLLHHVFVGVISAYITRHVLSWCVRWANQKSKLFKKLISYPIQFITTRIHLVKWKRGKAAPWQDIPLDVGKELGKRLLSRLDVLQFRSVCKNWRLSLPIPTLFPLRVPPPPTAWNRNWAYIITELNILYKPMIDMNSLHIAVEELDHGCKFRRPMTHPRLPDFNFPRGLAFMGGRKHPLSRMSFVGKVYFVHRGFIRSADSVQLDSRYSPVVKIVVISGSNVISSNAEGVNPSYVRASDLSVVALFRGGEMDGRLAVLRLGGRENWNNWNWDTGFCSHVFSDIGTYKGKLSAIDHSGRVFLMDYHSLEMTQITPPSDVAPGKYSKLLFEIDGDLYLADFSQVKAHLYFYKLDLQRGVWIGSNGYLQQESKLAALGPSFPFWVENTSPSVPDRSWASWLAAPIPRMLLDVFLWLYHIWYAYIYLRT